MIWSKNGWAHGQMLLTKRCCSLWIIFKFSTFLNFIGNLWWHTKLQTNFNFFCFRWTVPYWNKILSSSNINIREHPMSILGCIRVWMSISLTFLVLFLFNIILFWCLISLSQIFQNYLSKHVMSNFHLKYKFVIVHMNGSLGIK